jgi:predicted secreted protein
MPSNAFSGVGAEFRREDSPGAGTFTKIAEVNSITGPNMSRETIDVTSLDSTGGYREFIASFRDAGEVALEMNFTRNGWEDMKTDFESDDSVNYQIDFDDDENTLLDFAGYVTALGSAITTDDKVTASVTVKISGQVTPSSGA